MAGSKIRIRLFSVSAGAGKLVNLLEKAMGVGVAERNKPSARGGFVRMHDIRKEDNGLWLMHFVRSREYSSIKVSEEDVQKITYDREKKELPGEDIAALYAPDTRHMLLQESGHFRATPVRDYLNAFHGETVFNIEPVPADLGEFNPNKVKMLHFQLEPQWFSNQQFQKGMSLGQVLAMAHGDESLRVEIKISTTKKGAVLPQGIREIAEALSNRLKRNKKSDDVTKLSVGVLNPDNKADILNLRNPLVEVAIPMNLDAGWVFPLAERYKALLSQYEEWKAMLRMRRPSPPRGAD